MDEDRPGDSPDGEGQRDLASTRRDYSEARDESSEQRDESSTRRDGASTLRDGLSTERDGSSLTRDESAVQRDASSTRRDRVADDLDDEAARLDARDNVADRHTLGAVELRNRGRSGRTRAADDRARARHDRERSGEDRNHAEDDRTKSRGDREQAMHDRERAEDDRGDAEMDRDHAQQDRHNAGIDELTGARRRGVGFEDLKNEIRRAQREGGDRLVVAYIDVDGLKSVNDGQGHAAGDELLRAVATGLRREMRAYDLLVRLGGDEFLAVLPNVGLEATRERFGRVQSELALSANPISIGYTELRGGDSADDIVERADAALMAARASKRRE